MIRLNLNILKNKTIYALNILFNQNIIISYSNNIYYLISFYLYTFNINRNLGISKII